LGPLRSAVAGSAVLLEDSRTRRQIAGLRLIQRPHGGKDPQRLRIEGVTSPLRDAMVIDSGVRDSRGAFGEALPRIKPIAGEAATALDSTRVVVEVVVAAADGAPVQEPLILHVGELIEHAVQRLRLARPRAKDPSNAVRQPVRMAGATAAPRVLRH